MQIFGGIGLNLIGQNELEELGMLNDVETECESELIVEDKHSVPPSSILKFLLLLVRERRQKIENEKTNSTQNENQLKLNFQKEL